MTCKTILSDENQQIKERRPIALHKINEAEAIDDSSIVTTTESSVHFPSEVAEVVGYSPLRKEMWYTSTELIRFKSETRNKGYAIRNKTSSALLSTAHALGDRAFLFPKKKQDALNAWVKEDANRGLESHANHQYARERQEVRELVRYSVLEAQALRLSVHEIANISESHSRASRCFAQRMGKADELACACGMVTEKREKRRFSFGRRTSSRKSIRTVV